MLVTLDCFGDIFAFSAKILTKYVAIHFYKKALIVPMCCISNYNFNIALKPEDILASIGYAALL